MKTDQQLREGFKVFLSENNTINVTFSTVETEADNNGRQAELVYGDIMAIQNQKPETHFNFLVDVSNIMGMNFMSSKARVVYQQLAKNPQLFKAAVVGRSLFLNVIVNSLMHAAGKELSFRWFSKMEEARRWLTQK